MGIEFHRFKSTSDNRRILIKDSSKKIWSEGSASIWAAYAALKQKKYDKTLRLTSLPDLKVPANPPKLTVKQMKSAALRGKRKETKN